MSSSVLPTLPAQPANVPFPTQEWPLAKPKAGTDTVKLAALLDHAFGAKETEELGETHALLVIQNGAIVTERYAEGLSAQDTFPSWSMAKSVTHALMGILVRDGQLTLDKPAPIDIWHRSSHDQRAFITLDHLLRMQSGLSFEEVYDDPEKSHALPMLFGIGRLNMKGHQHLLELTMPGLFKAEKQVLGQLLGDGGSTLNPSRFKQGNI